MRSSRKLALVFVGMLAALAALEISLQAIAYVVWSTRASPPALPDDGAHVALCVGDSFTYGLGAADLTNAYPAAAQRACASADGPPVRFLNLGWPGQDSGRVFTRLPAQLVAYRPRLVYVLAGYNDFWREPGAASVDPDGFPLESRTLKLLSLIAAALAGGPPAAEPMGGQPLHEAPFLGAWHAGPVFFDFRSDGTIDTAEGPFDGVWSWNDDHLVVELRQQEQPVEMSWRLEDSRFVLEGGIFPQPIVLDRGMPTATALDRGRAAARRDDDDAAEREWRDALRDPALGFDARLELAALMVEQSRAREAIATLDPLLREAGDAVRSRRLAAALLAAGDDARAFDVVLGILREHGVDDALVQLLTRAALRAPDPAAFDAAIGAALTRSDLTDSQRLGLLGVRAAIGIDPDAALDALLEMARIDAEETTFVRTVRWNADEFPRERFVARAQRLPADQRAAAIAAYDRAAASADSTSEVLGRNLRAIVEACRRAGAEPVLMTYPGGREDVAAVVRALAAELETGLVDHLAHFATLLETNSRAELFVADGHCSDTGYLEMGRAVAADALARLR